MRATRGREGWRKKGTEGKGKGRKEEETEERREGGMEKCERQKERRREQMYGALKGI